MTISGAELQDSVNYRERLRRERECSLSLVDKTRIRVVHGHLGLIAQGLRHDAGLYLADGNETESDDRMEWAAQVEEVAKNLAAMLGGDREV